METAILIFGIFSIVLVVYDAIVTVLSHGGSGPITTFWTERLWRFLLYLRYNKGFERPILIAGPAMLIGIVAVWYVLLYVIWFLMISIGGYAIKNSNSSEQASLSEIIYFIGSSFSTLGIGDYVPTEAPWTILTTLGALVISSLISLSISYFVPVLNAVTEKRLATTKVELIGETAAEVLAASWSGETANNLNTEVSDIIGLHLTCAYQTHLYPVLTYFHSGNQSTSIGKSMLILFDALAVQQLLPERDGNLPKAKLKYFMRSVEKFVKVLDEQLSSVKNQDFNTHHIEFRAFLAENGVVIGKDRQHQFRQILELRERLLYVQYLEGSLMVKPSLPTSI